MELQSELQLVLQVKINILLNLLFVGHLKKEFFVDALESVSRGQ